MRSFADYGHYGDDSSGPDEEEFVKRKYEYVGTVLSSDPYDDDLTPGIYLSNSELNKLHSLRPNDVIFVVRAKR